MEIAQNDASYKERGRGVEFLKFSKKKGGGGITYFHTNPFQLVFGVFCLFTPFLSVSGICVSQEHILNFIMIMVLHYYNLI